MPLNDQKVKNAKLKPGAKQSKFHDMKGLFLIIDKNGRKIWRYANPHGKDGTLVNGQEVPVKEGMVFNVTKTNRS